MKPEFADFIQWGFYTIVSVSITYGVKILSSLKTSVDTLNIQVATILATNKYHEKEIEALRDDVRELQKKAVLKH